MERTAVNEMEVSGGGGRVALKSVTRAWSCLVRAGLAVRFMDHQVGTGNSARRRGASDSLVWFRSGLIVLEGVKLRQREIGCTGDASSVLQYADC